jgi:hypothetical protein
VTNEQPGSEFGGYLFTCATETEAKRLFIFKQIASERNYQDTKWGDRHRAVGEWLVIMEGELEEAKQAWRKSIGDEDTLAEIIQVAATAVHCLEQHPAINGAR